MKIRLTVEEVAKRLKITPRTLHYYEEMGLIQPSAHTEGGHRLYYEAAIAQLQPIRQLKDHLGYSLLEIRSMLRPVWSDSNLRTWAMSQMKRKCEFSKNRWNSCREL